MLRPRLTRDRQLLVRRAQIINANKDSAPHLWSAIEDILEQLEAAGMSSDQTDEEVSRDFKVVRKVQLPWRHNKLNALLANIDTYHAFVGSLRRGNRALPRIAEIRPSTSKSSRRCVRGLPKSFYDPQWLASLSNLERHKLDYATDVEIPQLVRAFI